MKILRCIPCGLFSILLSVVIGCQRQSHQQVIHVSPQGRDNWSGRFAQPNAEQTDGPLQSPAAAQNAMKQYKRDPRLSPGEIVVQLHAGVYPISTTLFFNAEDGARIPPKSFGGQRRVRRLFSAADGKSTSSNPLRMQQYCRDSLRARMCCRPICRRKVFMTLAR